jgi:hypothetical protein
MEMAVESMEMALGEIACPDRVPEQRFISPEIGLRWRRCCGTFLGETPIDLGFLRQRDYIGGRAMSGGGPGATPPGGATGGGVHHPMVCLPPGPPLSPLWTPSRVGENRNFGLRFVQF